MLGAVPIGPEELRFVPGRHHAGHMIHHILVSRGLKKGFFIVEMSGDNLDTLRGEACSFIGRAGKRGNRRSAALQSIHQMASYEASGAGNQRSHSCRS